MNGETIYKRASHVTFEVVAGEAILIDMNSGTYFSLDEVGTAFWEMMDGVRTLAQLAEQLAGQYNEKAGRYVAELGDLVQAGTPASTAAIESLALSFGLEEDDVQQHWRRLEETDFAAAARQLVTDFSVDPEQVVGDLVELVATMQADDLLVTMQ